MKDAQTATDLVILDPDAAAIVARLEGERDTLKQALESIIWKLSHNTSPSGNGGDCYPGRIDRNDATIRHAREVLDTIA